MIVCRVCRSLVLAGLATVEACSPGSAHVADAAPTLDAPDAAPGCSAPAADFVVATDGDDAASGTLAAPFATLARAQAAVRAVPRAGRTTPITVLVRGGTYTLTAHWALDASDARHRRGPDRVRRVSMRDADRQRRHVVLDQGQMLDGLWTCAAGDDCRSAFDLHDNDDFAANGAVSFALGSPAGTQSLAEFQAAQSEELGSISVDPRFAPGFTLPADSPALAIGFVPFPLGVAAGLGRC